MTADNDEIEYGADCRGKPRPEYPHIERKYENIIPCHIKQPSDKHACRGKLRAVVVPQESGNDLIEQIQGEYNLYGQKIAFRQRQKAFVCPEKQQYRTFQKQYARPCDSRKEYPL